MKPCSVIPTSLAVPLIKWYRSQGRHQLPWRGTFDPYHILVSEFMLQQTTVQTVVPYFRRFIKSFPSLKHLAHASLENVLEHWSGLGYYTRAKNLHHTARLLLEKHGGLLPKNPGTLLTLPGVGPYTAGALASFAHNHPAPLVDGNVQRVYCRVFGIKSPPRLPSTQKRIWGLAREALPAKKPRLFNSALMDLGALICRPLKPNCSLCPLSASCWAYQHGQTHRIPKLSATTKPKTVFMDTLIVSNKNRLFLQKRPTPGLWAGLWDFPTRDTSSRKGDEPWKLHQTSLSLNPIPFGEARHAISHRIFHLTLWRGDITGTPAKSSSNSGWFSPAQIREMAVSRLTRKVLDKWENNK